MKYENETFTNEVELDGNEFIGCVFENCTVVYSGGKQPLITRCSFNNFTFEFRGCADNTVTFLRSMASPSSGLQSIVRETFPGLSAH